MAADRLESLLLGLAQQHVPIWSRIYNPSDPKRVARLARHLASYNLLVIMGDFPQSLSHLDTSYVVDVQNWVDGYTQLYLLLARALFPSSMNISAQYADNQWPVIIIITGASTPVIEALAGFAAPYVAARQSARQVSEMELLGLMEIILETLEASTLPRDAYKQLLNEGAALLKRLLNAPIPQYAITEFDRQVFTDSQNIIPVKIEPTAPPTVTPPINTRAVRRDTVKVEPRPAPQLPPEPPTLPEEDSAKLREQDTKVDIAALKPQQAAYELPDTEKLNSTQTVINGPDGQTPEAKAPPPPPPMVLPPRKDSGKPRRPPVPRLPGQED